MKSKNVLIRFNPTLNPISQSTLRSLILVFNNTYSEICRNIGSWDQYYKTILAVIELP